MKSIQATDTVGDVLRIIRGATCNRIILDAAGALGCYCRSLERVIAAKKLTRARKPAKGA